MLRKLEPEPRPINNWVIDDETDVPVRYRWECSFCGYREFAYRDVSYAGPVGESNDEFYNIYSCWHCSKDVDGYVNWQLYRQGSCGYYGDGDFEWNGSWKGTKPVMVHRPLDCDRDWGWFGKIDQIPGDRPDTQLEITAWSHRGRVKAYSVRLQFTSWRYNSILLVDNKRVTSLKQLTKEVDALDYADAAVRLLKEYYQRKTAKCVWRWEDNQWHPFMTSFGYASGFELPYGRFAVWDPHYNKYSKIERDLYSVGGWTVSCGPRVDVGDPPLPWTTQDGERVIIQEDTQEVTKQLDSA